MSPSKVNQYFFVEPGQNVDKGDTDYVTLARLSRDDLRNRWETPKGRYILSTWKANRFERATLDNLVGKFYGHTDLRGVVLARETMSGVNLSEVDLFYADLHESHLDYVDLTNSYLSEANLRGVRLDWAKMQDALVDNVDFDNRTSFTGVKLSGINFTLAEQLKDFAFSQQRIANLKTKHPRLATVLWLTCDYGRSFNRFFAWCGGVILIFALAYGLIPGAINRPGFWNGLYFSVMTFTTLGSEIQAASVIGRVLVSLEAGIGFLMTGLLVAILVKRTIGD